jgi:hypothetical protein
MHIQLVWKYLFKCFLYISKIQWVEENECVPFLMVSPKDTFAQLIKQCWTCDSDYTMLLHYFVMHFKHQKHCLWF